MIKSKTIFRLLKALIFVFLVLGYGYLAGIEAQVVRSFDILFALILAMYLIELYKKREK